MFFADSISAGFEQRVPVISHPLLRRGRAQERAFPGWIGFQRIVKKSFPAHTHIHRLGVLVAADEPITIRHTKFTTLTLCKVIKCRKWEKFSRCNDNKKKPHTQLSTTVSKSF